MTPHWTHRLPFYYGWLIIFVAFVTMAIAVSARTSFSLLVPPLIDEYGWDRGLVAGAFSFGFLVSAVIGPFVGPIMQKHGPRIVTQLARVLDATKNISSVTRVLSVATTPSPTPLTK